MGEQMTVFERIRASYPRMTYAAVAYPAKNRGMFRRDETYPHTELTEDNARAVLEGLRDSGWGAVCLYILAADIPTHTNAAFAIDELLVIE